MRKYIFITILITIFAISCKEMPIDVAVYVNTEFIKNNSVIIDDTLLLKLNHPIERYFIKFILKSGEHTISINKNTEEHIEISKEGGILNVAKDEFVVFPIKYSTNEVSGSLSMSVTCPMIFDSLVVYDKLLAENQARLIELFNEPIYKKFFIDNPGRIGGHQLFIPKIWDYEVDDEIPQEISVNEKDLFVKTAFKRKITFADVFLEYAKASSNYKVELIESDELKNLIMKIHQ